MDQAYIITPRLEILLPSEALDHLNVGNGKQVHVTLLPNNTVEIRPEGIVSTTSKYSYREFLLEKELETLRRRIAFYEHEEDKEAEKFITSICASITDAPSALRASQVYYTKDWFSDLGFSLSKKIEFCRRLIDAVSIYNSSYASGLWKNVVSGTPEAIKAIDVRDVRSSDFD
jgi:hypothetical protein